MSTESSFKDYNQITPEIKQYAELCQANNTIPADLYQEYKVNRGLRDLQGRGVLTGLTEISTIISSKQVDGKSVSCDGELYYRGIKIEDLVDGFINEKRHGFEEATYLLLFGELPNKTQLDDFKKLLVDMHTLPTSFVRDIIMKAPSMSIMNMLSRGVLTLYSYDSNPEDNSVENVLRQCLQLIALFPSLSVYSFQAHNYYHKGKSLYIHDPDPELSTAENILYQLRPDNHFTELEAKILDVALVLHAEHGGGNNSTFTMHVVTSSGTDTYSSVAAALSSLKGPKHGGANIKVVEMIADMKKNISDWTDDEEISTYLAALLNREAFDNAGLIYGMGHAVYSLSDPRANIFKGFVEKLSAEKGRTKEYGLYSKVARLAPEIIGREKKIYKGVSANIDFFSGFVYSMLDLPLELYTPIFAISRISGWSAHRIEELVNGGKIIRPAYKSVADTRDYALLTDR